MASYAHQFALRTCPRKTHCVDSNAVDVSRTLRALYPADSTVGPLAAGTPIPFTSPADNGSYSEIVPYTQGNTDPLYGAVLFNVSGRYLINVDFAFQGDGLDSTIDFLVVRVRNGVEQVIDVRTQTITSSYQTFAWNHVIDIYSGDIIYVAVDEETALSIAALNGNFTASYVGF